MKSSLIFVTLIFVCFLFEESMGCWNLDPLQAKNGVVKMPKITLAINVEDPIESNISIEEPTPVCKNSSPCSKDSDCGKDGFCFGKICRRCLR